MRGSTSSTSAPATATAVPAPDPGRWKSLAVILAAAFLVGLDFFVVNVSIPSIRSSLHATFAEVQLVIASYGLTYARAAHFANRNVVASLAMISRWYSFSDPVTLDP